MDPNVVTLARQRIDALVHYLDTYGWESFDPYDGLISPLASILPRRVHLSTRIWQQGVRVFPFNARPVLGIRPIVHTKAVSDLTSAFSLLGDHTGEGHWRKRAAGAVATLRDIRSIADPYSAWGLRFPFVTRFIYASADEANVFQTINAIHALLDVHEHCGDAEALALARSGITYLVDGLGYEREGDGLWWRYWRGRTVRIVNVSGLMLGLCARMMGLDDAYPYREWGHGLYRFLVRHQNVDGSWYYALDEQGRFIDGYHTGYVLEGIARAVKAGLVPLEEPLRRGSRFYTERLIAEDAIPLYYIGSRYPLDGQLVAQTIQTLIFLADVGLAHPEEAGRVFKACDRLLWDHRGYYDYQRRKYRRYTTPMHRWVTGPMLLALTYLLRYASKEK